MIWRIKALLQWVWEYITLTPQKYDAAISKLESLLWFATGGMYSKAGYALSDMEHMVNDYIEQCCEEAVKEAQLEVVPCDKCKRHMKCPIEEQLHRVKAKKRFCGLGKRREEE